MNELYPGDTPSEAPHNSEANMRLECFLREVANTRLKIKILEVFLNEPYLCLSVESLAERIGENASCVRESARQLHACDAFLYCPSFGYADLCCLSLQYHSPVNQNGLRLLRAALHKEPQGIWERVV